MIIGGIMKTTLNIPDDLIKEAMTASQSRTKTEAVITGLKELIRQSKIERVLSAAGKLEFSDEWEKARHGR
jgi:Arc/MetJ family transcription regulator